MVGPEAADAPAVVSIALAPGVIVPAAGFTGATIDVIITLSEAAKAFTAADHLDVTHATAADPVALDPVAEQTVNRRLKPVLRRQDLEARHGYARESMMRLLQLNLLNSIR